MKDQFTHFEFQMYLMPGAVFTLSLFIINSVFQLIQLETGQLDLLGSILFLILSFVFGQLLQARAHEEPERRMKDQYWDGLFPTQRMFLLWKKKYTPIISEDLRSKLLDICVSKNLLSIEERSQCDQGKQIQGLTDRLEIVIFNLRYNLLSEEKISSRIDGAEARYQAFRGLFVGAFWSGILSVLSVVAGVVMHLLGAVTSPSLKAIAGLVLWGILNLVLWRVFRWRCRGAAQGFARELARAAITVKL